MYNNPGVLQGKCHSSPVWLCPLMCVVTEHPMGAPFFLCVCSQCVFQPLGFSKGAPFAIYLAMFAVFHCVCSQCVLEPWDSPRERRFPPVWPCSPMYVMTHRALHGRAVFFHCVCFHCVLQPLGFSKRAPFVTCLAMLPYVC